MKTFEDFHKFIEDIDKEGFDMYLDGMKVYPTRYEGVKKIGVPFLLSEIFFNELVEEIITENGLPIRIKFNNTSLDTIKDFKGVCITGFKFDNITITYKCRTMIFDIIWDRDDKTLPDIRIADVPVKPERILDESGLEKDALSFLEKQYRTRPISAHAIKYTLKVIE